MISVPFDNFRMRFQKKKISKIRNDEEYVFYQWRLREHELFNELNICGFDNHGATFSKRMGKIIARRKYANI